MTETTSNSYPSIAQSWVIAVIVVGMAIVAGPLTMLDGWIGAEAAICLYYIVAFGISFLIINTMRKRRLGSSPFRFAPGPWKRVGLMALGSVALLFGVVTPLGTMIPTSDLMAKALVEAAGQRGIWTFVYFVLAAPLLEELIFRGIILDGLLKRYRPLTAILMSALIFGVVHLNPHQFVTGLVLGSFLGWVYFHTGSVGSCITIHMAANLSGYILRFIVDVEDSIGMSVLDMYGGGPGRFAVIELGILVLAGASILLLKKEFDAKRGQVEAPQTGA